MGLRSAGVRPLLYKVEFLRDIYFKETAADVAKLICEMFRDPYVFQNHHILSPGSGPPRGIDTASTSSRPTPMCSLFPTVTS